MVGKSVHCSFSQFLTIFFQFPLGCFFYPQGNSPAFQCILLLTIMHFFCFPPLILAPSLLRFRHPVKSILFQERKQHQRHCSRGKRVMHSSPHSKIHPPKTVSNQMTPMRFLFFIHLTVAFHITLS